MEHTEQNAPDFNVKVNMCVCVREREREGEIIDIKLYGLATN